jgi:hypothetical protein
VTPSSSWLLKEVEVHIPLKGKSYYVTCNRWLAKDKDDGLTIRKFNLDDATTKVSTYKKGNPLASPDQRRKF